MYVVRMRPKLIKARLFRAMSVVLAALLVCAGVFSSHSAEAAAVDCDKDTGETAKLVCADSELIELDVILANLYESAVRGMRGQDRKSLQANQREWFERRDKCIGQDAGQCLAERYNERILVLEVQYGQGESTEPLIYRCDELEQEIHVAFFKTDPPAVSLSLNLSKDPVTAIRQQSDKGEKYVTADGLVFWAAGDEASLALVDGKKATCHLK
jgi:uncharacterized protein